jgi:L-fucose isomerase-like protein
LLSINVLSIWDLIRRVEERRKEDGEGERGRRREREKERERQREKKEIQANISQTEM